MSEIPCRCGSSISDNTDYLPHKAIVLEDQDWMDALEDAAAVAAEFIAAVRDGRREAWVAENLGYGPESDATLVFELVVARLTDRGVDAYECEACGRLLIRRGVRTRQFAAFSPDSGTREGVLASEFNARDGRRSRERR